MIYFPKDKPKSVQYLLQHRLTANRLVSFHTRGNYATNVRDRFEGQVDSLVGDEYAGYVKVGNMRAFFRSETPIKIGSTVFCHLDDEEGVVSAKIDKVQAPSRRERKKSKHASPIVQTTSSNQGIWEWKRPIVLTTINVPLASKARSSGQQ